MRPPLDIMRIRPFQFGDYNPISNTFGHVRSKGKRAHQGWDLIAPVGTPVYAVADGEVTPGLQPGYGLGVLLAFTHDRKQYYAFYGHLFSSMGGGSVMEGTQIALTGTSGNAAGIPVAEAHLHFEIRTIARPGLGLRGRVDPGEVFGYEIYSCEV